MRQEWAKGEDGEKPKEAAMKERVKAVAGHRRLIVGVVTALGAIGGLLAWRRHKAHAA
jgi:hypothetical protein